MKTIKKFDEFINESKKTKETTITENANPEGDAKVLAFLKRLAKEWDLPVGRAADFVKASIKRNGY